MRAWAAVLAILAALAASHAASAAMAGPTLELTADVWKRQVLQEEPILVRVALANTGDRPLSIVPPYFPPDFVHRSFALRLMVEGADGTWGEPKPTASRAYWLHAWTRPDAAALVHAPWVVEAGTVAVTWCSLNLAYVLEEPGRYHFRLCYGPTPGMAATAGVPPSDVWSGTLDIDLGWVEIAEPPEAEVAVRDLLLRSTRACATGMNGDPDAASSPIAEKWPGSAYRPYVEFWALHATAEGGAYRGLRSPRGLALIRSRVEAFRAAYPDFPLNHQLDTFVAWYAYGVALNAAYPPVVPPNVPTREQVLRVLEAARELRAAAEASGDRGLAAEVEVCVGWAERAHTKHIEAALAGREPE